jgi:hypothetical protein
MFFYPSGSWTGSACYTTATTFNSFSQSKIFYYIIYTGTLWVPYRYWFVQVLFCRLQVGGLVDPIHIFFSVTKMYTFFFVYVLFILNTYGTCSVVVALRTTLIFHFKSILYFKFLKIRKDDCRVKAFSHSIFIIKIHATGPGHHFIDYAFKTCCYPLNIRK